MLAAHIVSLANVIAIARLDVRLLQHERVVQRDVPVDGVDSVQPVPPRRAVCVPISATVGLHRETNGSDRVRLMFGAEAVAHKCKVSRFAPVALPKTDNKK